MVLGTCQTIPPLTTRGVYRPIGYLYTGISARGCNTRTPTYLTSPSTFDIADSTSPREGIL